ncbi:lytic murein transglycosylase [Parashewanella curva]|uniref:Lytic murein transglycosylase n=1 Tax=Parashewanella curva TaxID=2338552 RepID=A0A3L8Q1M5_9GAMM|nr:lytic murein transglycosylase [Parashewanella curva]RLV60633.1 lytic murein transglycosylase [Parashewanella curva]
MNKTSLLAFCLLFSSTVASAQDTEFYQCLSNLKLKAKAEGISEATIADSLNRVKPRPKVVKLDKNQPEFSATFENYFNRRVNAWRISKGQKLWRKHRKLLNQLTVKYGIPGQYILAFWGLETNFGGYKGKMPIIDSLVTLACKPRRGKYFTQELIQALKIKQKNGFSYEKMKGSWAGAMGHTQFMPTAYAKYAVDGDGDGKADLWNSEIDALTSAANFLQHLGWTRGERWGREVKLPQGFDFSPIGEQQDYQLKKWQQLGVTMADGRPLSVASMKAKLYLPSGHTGPAFLAYSNFNTIMRWNNSVFYAISVGHLADRIAGGTRLVVQPPKLPRIPRGDLKAMQKSLNALGYDTGKPDGIVGSRTILAIQKFQKKKGLVADGYPNEEVLNLLVKKRENLKS